MSSPTEQRTEEATGGFAEGSSSPTSNHTPTPTAPPQYPLRLIDHLRHLTNQLQDPKGTLQRVNFFFDRLEQQLESVRSTTITSENAFKEVLLLLQETERELEEREYELGASLVELTATRAELEEWRMLALIWRGEGESGGMMERNVWATKDHLGMKFLPEVLI
jgi:hypothetical protein